MNSQNQEQEPINFTTWSKIMADLYGNNGKIAVGYYLSVLYHDVIVEELGFFPHLHLHGPPASGKSSLSFFIRSMLPFMDIIIVENLTQTDSPDFSETINWGPVILMSHDPIKNKAVKEKSISLSMDNKSPKNNTMYEYLLNLQQSSQLSHINDELKQYRGIIKESILPIMEGVEVGFGLSNSGNEYSMMEVKKYLLPFCICTIISKYKILGFQTYDMLIEISTSMINQKKLSQIQTTKKPK